MCKVKKRRSGTHSLTHKTQRTFSTYLTLTTNQRGYRRSRNTFSDFRHYGCGFSTYSSTVFLLETSIPFRLTSDNNFYSPCVYLNFNVETVHDSSLSCSRALSNSISLKTDSDPRTFWQLLPYEFDSRFLTPKGSISSFPQVRLRYIIYCLSSDHTDPFLSFSLTLHSTRPLGLTPGPVYVGTSGKIPNKNLRS